MVEKVGSSGSIPAPRRPESPQVASELHALKEKTQATFQNRQRWLQTGTPPHYSTTPTPDADRVKLASHRVKPR